MCGAGQLLSQCGPETPPGWTPRAENERPAAGQGLGRTAYGSSPVELVKTLRVTTQTPSKEGN